MGDGCSSNPTSGCGDNSGLVAEIRSSNDKVVTKLTAINTSLTTIKENAEDCCEETNGNLTDIKSKLDTLISNAATCCEAITDRLDVIKGILEAPASTGMAIQFTDYVCQEIDNLEPVTTTTTEQATTSTEEATTTTEEATTTTEEQTTTTSELATTTTEEATTTTTLA